VALDAVATADQTRERLHAMTWAETKQRLLEAAQSIRRHKVLDAGTRTLLGSIPVVGGFAEKLWETIDAGDDERAAQIADLLEAAARQEAAFEELKREIDDHGEILLATHASVGDILGRVTAVQASVTRVEARLDDLFSRLEAKPVMQALHAEVVLADDLAAASELIEEADRAVLDAGQDLSPENLFRLGVVYQATGHNEQAKASFLAATERDPTMAAAYAEKALALDNANVQVLVQMGYNEKELAQRYLGAGRESEAAAWIDRARAHFRMALGVDDANAGAHNGLGSIAIVLRDYDEAIAECTRAIELDPKYLSAHHDLAGAFYGKAVTSWETRRIEALTGERAG
jgi:tetratricopeptide (TPR) repeat protein